MAFSILKRSKTSLARIGLFKTPHGEIQTPAFVPVATQAALKGVLPKQAKDAGTQILMVNTYHLWARGMEDVVEKLGGLNKFMSWQGPLMTDSGGFQVLSLGVGYGSQLSKIVKKSSLFHGRGKEAIKRGKPIKKGTKQLVSIDDRGVIFRSHTDGSVKRLTPKISIQIQEKLGADITFALDECTSPLDSYQYTKEALRRTHLWAKESLEAKKRKSQLIFGIIQGGRFKDLRQESAKYIASLDFDGFGIGGGFGKEDITTVLEWVIPLLSPTKPRHFLGIGEIEDIKESVKRGIDLFDCVIPTRFARHGVLITKKGRVTIGKTSWKNDRNPAERDCTCFTCQKFSRAYLSHLSKAGEMLAIQLAAIHNIFFYNRLMEGIRYHIAYGKL